jgi:glycine/D-amino acid oxidase-like deaminating enzyme
VVGRANSSANYDVVVVGGGPAGIAAALSSARRGAHTLLVERSARLGGNAANAFVHTICGLYEPADRGDAVPLHPGLPEQLANELLRIGAASPPIRAGRVYVLPLDPPRFAAHVTALCERTVRLEVATESELIEAAFDTRDSARLSIGRRTSGARSFTAGIVIDASGDATVACLTNAPTTETDANRLQLPSFIFRMAGVDCSELAGFAKLRVTHALATAARDGSIPAQCESVLLRPVAGRDEVYVTLNVPRPADGTFRPLDQQHIDSLTTRARSNAEQIAKFLRDTRPAFARSRIDAWPHRLGVRETRRVVGHREISRQHVLEGRLDPDEVCRSSWPIELWTDHRRARFDYPAGPCSVPLGALVSQRYPQLGMAGRCLSASHEAAGALRVIGTALATGEAIGVAAALAADRRVRLDAIAASEIRAHILDSDPGGSGK